MTGISKVKRVDLLKMKIRRSRKGFGWVDCWEIYWNVFLEWLNLLEVAWGCLNLLELAWGCLNLLELAWTCLNLLELAWANTASAHFFGATPYYTIVFSNVKWGRLMIVFPTDYKTFSLFTNPNLFLVHHKKIFKFLIHKIYITFLLCIRNRILTPNPINIISISQKIPIKSFSIIHGVIWLIGFRVGRTLSYGKYDLVNSL